MLRGVLVLEAFDSVSLGALKQEPDHRVVEAPVDEIIDDCAKFQLAAEVVEVAHLRGTWGKGARGSSAAGERAQPGTSLVEVDVDSARGEEAPRKEGSQEGVGIG